MEFEWDDAKDADCFARRGFDFRLATRIFDDPDRAVTRDDRRAYGEMRYRATGRIDGRVFVVVFTLRGNRIRIISARKANRQEVRHHGDNPREA